MLCGDLRFKSFIKIKDLSYLETFLWPLLQQSLFMIWIDSFYSSSTYELTRTNGDILHHLSLGFHQDPALLTTITIPLRMGNQLKAAAPPANHACVSTYTRNKSGSLERENYQSRTSKGVEKRLYIHPGMDKVSFLM